VRFVATKRHIAAWLVSRPYVIAMYIAILEYALESTYTPWLKCGWVTAIGVPCIVVGETLRKAGIMTAGSAFTHRIAVERRSHHALVTHGVYGVVRHPGYAGWMLWAIGTQLVLCNPVCTIAFCFIVSRNYSVYNVH
jgi:protein-S-isoprenylcysteine O-methyltransferase